MNDSIHPIRVESELVRTCHLEPIQLGDLTLVFVLEIYKMFTAPLYYAIVRREETFRIQPTFPQEKGNPAHDPCDESLLVWDPVIGKWSDMEPSIENAITRACREIEAFLQKNRATFRFS